MEGEGRPSGTVTFLFTDVVGSSSLWEEHRSVMAEALARHDDLVRTTVAAHGGYVFSTAGDAFSVAFAEPASAVQAALAVQDALSAEPWPSPLAIQVRIGLHTGTAEERGGDYFGPTLNRAARIMGLAGAAEVVASAATAELARELGRHGVEFAPLGTVELRGVGPERVVGVVPPGGASTFAGARSTGASTRVHLPSLATTFVGRELEVVELASALPRARLVTLVGPGGVGKTRLAIETGWVVAEEFPDGVWLVELAPVRDRDAVAHTFVISLGARPVPGLSPSEALLAGLSGERRLVIVDNSEHLVDEVGAVTRLIVERCPTVTLLATSRVALGVPGERVWPVAPLAPGGAGAALFHDRAAAAGTSGLEGADLAVETLCARLDGMPLAIELAAARARAMTPAEMVARLDDRFRLLRAPRSDVDPRHATLQATLEWSYQLLDEQTRTILDRLGVFAGPVDVAAVVAIAADEEVDDLDVVDALTTLVDHSLVVAEQSAGTTRYRLLDTMRAFARRRLQDRQDLDRLVRAHAEWAVDRVTALNDALVAPDERTAVDAVDQMERFWPDLRAAVTAAIEAADVALVARLLGEFSAEALLRDREELAGWMDRALELGGIGERPQACAILGIAAQLAWRAGRFDVMNARVERAAALRAAGATDPRLGFAQSRLITLLVSGHTAEARAIGREELARHAGDVRVEAGVLRFVVGVIDCYLGEARRALAAIDASASTASPILLSLAGWIRTMAYLELDPAEAIARGQATERLARASRLSFVVDSVSNYLTAALARAGEPAEALATMRAVLAHASSGGGVQSLANTARNAIVLFARLGPVETVALLAGWLDAQPFSVPGTATMRAHAADAVAQVVERLGRGPFERLRAQGAATSTADVVALLIGVLDQQLSPVDADRRTP